MFVLLTQECFITLGVHILRSILSSKAVKKSVESHGKNELLVARPVE